MPVITLTPRQALTGPGAVVPSLPDWTGDFGELFLVAGDPGASDNFGNAHDTAAGAAGSVFLTRDEQYLFISAVNNDVTVTDQGRVYVFRFGCSAWRQVKVIDEPGTPSAGERFGQNIAASYDGAHLLIATANSKWHYFALEGSPAIHVHKQTITDPETVSGLQFGSSLDISDDGTVALIGNYSFSWSTTDGYPSNVTQAGKAYVYDRSGAYDSWSPAFNVFYGNDIVTANFGASAFTYSIPSGYSAYGSGVTWDPSNVGSGVVLSNGNLTATGDNAAHNAGRATELKTSGKWYWETTMVYTAAGGTIAGGIQKAGQNLDTPLGYTPDGIGGYQNGNVNRNSSTIATVGAWPSGTVLRHKLDVDAGTYEIAVSGGAFNFIDDLGIETWTLTEEIDSPDPITSGHMGGSFAMAPDGTHFLVGQPEQSGTQGMVFAFALSSQAQKITDPLGATNDRLGTAVAVSGNNTRIAIGAWGNGTGRVLVYVLSGNSYVLEDTLTPSNGQTGQEFGQYVDINTSGDYIVVGADAYDGVNNNEGRGYVFTRSGSTWTEQDILVATDAALSDALGPCAISNAGDIVVMGAQNADAGASNSGAAYVFTRSGSTWTQAAKLLDPSPSVDARMGIGVDVSGDGSTIAVGVYTFSTTTIGKALVFVSPSWTFQSTLQGADLADDDDFGRSVALSEDGDVAIVGAYSDDISGQTRAGSAYIFNRTGTSWSETQKLVADTPQQDARMGVYVDISALGDKVLVGATGWDEGIYANNGTAYQFELNGTWSQTQQFLPDDPLASKSYGSVAGGDDYSIVAVGANGDTIGGNASQGSVYVNGTLLWTHTQTLTKSASDLGMRFGRGKIAMSANGNIAVVPAAEWQDGSNFAGGFFVYTRSGGVWTEQQAIQTSDSGSFFLSTLGDNSAMSISNDGSTIVGGAPQQEINTFTGNGAAYVWQGAPGSYVEHTKFIPSGLAQNQYYGRSTAIRNNNEIFIAGPGIGKTVSNQGIVYNYKQDVFYDDFSLYGGIWYTGSPKTVPYTEVNVAFSDQLVVDLDGGNPSILITVPSDSGYGEKVIAHDDTSLQHGIVRCRTIGIGGGGTQGTTAPGLCARYVNSTTFYLMKIEFHTGRLIIAERRTGFPNVFVPVSYPFSTAVYYYMELDFTSTDPVARVYTNPDNTGLVAEVTYAGANINQAGSAGIWYGGDTNARGRFDDLYIFDTDVPCP